MSSLACLLACLSLARPTRATPASVEVDLPIGGLRVALPVLDAAGWSVRPRWDGERAEDELTTAVDGVPTIYVVTLGGRTARDCPLRDPFPVELDGETWIRDADGVLCRTLPDARVEVRVAPAPEDEAALTRHRPVLAALLEALRARRVTPHPTSLPPPETPVARALTLPLAGLAFGLPGPAGEAGYWRVAPATEARRFDALVRVVPVFPEVQVSVRRHARAEVASCGRLQRHLRDQGWSRVEAAPPTGWRGALGRRIGHYAARAVCLARPEDGGALLDVRFASHPEVPLAHFRGLLEALASARAIAPAPPSEVPLAPVSDVAVHTVACGLGLDFAGTVVRGAAASSRASRGGPYASLELGLAWMMRNGPLFGGALTVGADAHGARLGATLDAGVALALDAKSTLGFMLAFEDRTDALYANRSLSWAIELRSDWHRPRAFAWSLRVVALQLASREPAISGLPLAIGWQGIFPSGLVLGVDLRAIASPPRASEGWPSEGIGVGLRVGYGGLSR